MYTRKVVIIGAGIAGAATAYFLAKRGVRSVVLLEREPIPGAHSTGRNAAILRTLVGDPALGRLADESLAFFHSPPREFATRNLLRRVGVFVAASEDAAGLLRKWAGNPDDERSFERDAAELYRHVPPLAPGLVAAVHRSDEGVIDVHALLQAFLSGARAAGAEVRLGWEVKRLKISGERVVGLYSTQGELDADCVVIAAGGWAAHLGRETGYPLPLVPYRRHLLVTGLLPQVDPNWPVVWIAGDEFYFRPESGGLLMCACDSVPVSPQEGEMTDPGVISRIAAKAERWLPSLGEAEASHFWAGMRTFAPDQRFVIGADPRLQGLHWVAGLGGHGITCGPAVGELAAEWVLEGESRHPSATLLEPGRLLDRGTLPIRSA